uniref:Uncharacterized protein n=1 Tax=Anguilla anguilla TaxID=7936 RepID=A0A0E9S7H5_ANGAN
MVYPLVHLLLVVQHHEGFGRRGVPVEDEAEVSTLALHVGEVYESGVQPDVDALFVDLASVRRQHSGQQRHPALKIPVQLPNKSPQALSGLSAASAACPPRSLWTAASASSTAP